MKTQKAVKDRAEGSGWGTAITRIEANRIEVAGYPLSEVIGRISLPEVAFLLFTGVLPERRRLKALHECILEAARHPAPLTDVSGKNDLSRTLGRFLLQDESFPRIPQGNRASGCEQALACVGRLTRYLAAVWKTEEALEKVGSHAPFSHLLYHVCTGSPHVDECKAAMLEAMTVATVDHGVTAPSAQAAILAASVRAPYDMAVSQGICTITDVHGGAGQGAAEFFLKGILEAEKSGMDLSASLRQQILEHVRRGRRIPGLGHRVHTKDPRSDALYAIAKKTKTAAHGVQRAVRLQDLVRRVCGRHLPVNVDGAIGAIVADMDCRPVVAKAVFILGRTCGISAHYVEELTTFPAMRWIDFSEAIYTGPPTRSLLSP